jgi:transposase InsO family protein
LGRAAEQSRASRVAGEQLGSPNRPRRPRAPAVAHLNQYIEATGKPARGAAIEFVRGVNSGLIELPEEVRAAIPTLAGPTLDRWRRDAINHGMEVLGGNYGNRLGCGYFNFYPERRHFVIAMIARYHAQARASAIREHLCTAFPPPHPSISSVQREVARIRKENPSMLLRRSNPDRWRSTHRSKIGDADEMIVRYLAELQIDGSPGDCILADGRRHHILALIDVWSRRVMFLVSRSENAFESVQLVRRAILAWGVPELIHGDNGRAFISAHMQRFLADLDIRYKASPPFSPETKPFVESVIHTMSMQVLELCPGFAGHSVAGRQEIRARLAFAERFGAPPKKIFSVRLTAPELQARLDNWSNHIYGNRVHSGIAMAPNERAASWAGEVRRIGDERALDGLCGEGVLRRIEGHGVALAGARFCPPPERADWMEAYYSHVGRQAYVIPDSDDMGRAIVYLQPENDGARTFLCVAESYERLGHRRHAAAQLAREVQDRLMREGGRELRRLRDRIKPETVVDAHLEIAASRAPTWPVSPDQVALAHETPNLAAAAVAADALASIASPAARKPRESDAREDQMFDRLGEAAERRMEKIRRSAI